MEETRKRTRVPWLYEEVEGKRKAIIVQLDGNELEEKGKKRNGVDRWR